ncbi:toxic anion resistance protein [Acidithiobacillus sp. MC6.1]|nr:toxic anion resistance protein [Acidithiobacillus sp. MC6.1]
MPEVTPLFDEPSVSQAAMPQPVPQPTPMPPMPFPERDPVPTTPPNPVHIESTIMALPTDADIDHLTQDARAGYASVTEKLLATHKTADMGDMGTQLNGLLMTAKGLDPKQQKSMIGKLMTHIRGEKEQILAHTQSVQGRIKELEAQMDQSANLQRQRIQDLDGLKKENVAHYQKLADALTRCTAWQQQTAQALTLPVDTADPLHGADPQAGVKRSALQKLDQRLQITLNDLKNAQILDQQQALELQATQDNARAILDEFDRAKNIAVPALTALVAQQLIAIEQREAVKVDGAIRDMVTQAMTQAAQTLGDNSIRIATMQQQAIIGVDTLEQCQGILEQSAAKVHEIEAQGAAQRKIDEGKRADLERRLLSGV